jgi:hypothetical protein
MVAVCESVNNLWCGVAVGGVALLCPWSRELTFTCFRRRLRRSEGAIGDAHRFTYDFAIS